MLAWLRYYTDPTSPGFGNQSRSSQLAGYPGRKGSSAWAVQGHRNANHAVLQPMILEALDDAGCTVEHGAKRLKEAMDAKRQKYFMAKSGNVVCTPPEPDVTVRLRATLAMYELRRQVASRAQTEMVEASEEGSEKIDSIAIDGNPEQIAALKQEVKQMPVSDRMLARHEIGLYRRILKIKEKQVEQGTEYEES